MDNLQKLQKKAWPVCLVWRACWWLSWCQQDSTTEHWTKMHWSKKHWTKKHLNRMHKNPLFSALGEENEERSSEISCFQCLNTRQLQRTLDKPDNSRQHYRTLSWCMKLVHGAGAWNYAFARNQLNHPPSIILSFCRIKNRASEAGVWGRLLLLLMLVMLRADQASLCFTCQLQWKQPFELALSGEPFATISFPHEML